MVSVIYIYIYNNSWVQLHAVNGPVFWKEKGLKMKIQCQSWLFMHNSNQNRILHTPRQRTIYNFQTLHGEYSVPHWFNPQPSSRQVSRFHDRKISISIERRKLVSSWLRTHRPRLRSISEDEKKLKKI